MKSKNQTKNRIGLAIATYTINYGTFLQAFATQTATENLGYDTTILNINSVIDDVSKARKRYFLGQLLNLAEVKSYTATVNAIIQKKINPKYKEYYQEREKKFKEFHDKYFKIANHYNSRRKAFISPKDMEKLVDTIEQNKKKEEFLEWYQAEYLHGIS